jgi:PAS domain S-box-containing protein
MAAIVREHRWCDTPLGDIGAWPASLCAAVTTTLDAPLPMLLLWGPELIQIHNDAYQRIARSRQQRVIGQPFAAFFGAPSGPSATLGADATALRRVMQDGASVLLEVNAIDPAGLCDSRPFTVACWPARDQHGLCCGVFVVSLGTTLRIDAGPTAAAPIAALTADQLRDMFDLAPGFMALLRTADHVFEMTNVAYRRLLPQRNLLGLSVRNAIPEAESQGFIKLLDDAYRSGKPFVASGMPILLQENGAVTRRYLDFIYLIYQPLKDADGNVTAIFVDGHDVTEQHRAHAELALLHVELTDKVLRLERAERRRSFQLELADRLRSASTLVDVVAAACALLGDFLTVARVVFCEVDDAAGTFIVRHEWVRSGLSGVSGQLRTLDDFGTDNIATLRSGQMFACSDTRFDIRTAAHAAAYAKIDIIASLALPLVRNGQLLMILNLQQIEPHQWSDEDVDFARDMAERTWSAIEATRAQDELRAERDRSQYIFNNLSEGFGLLDADWRVIQMNAEGLRLGQRSAADVIGKRHPDIWPATVGTDIEHVYRRVMAGGQPEIIEQKVTCSNGSDLWLEVRVHRVLGGELAIFYHDITGRKNALIALIDDAHNKDEFMAMLAHELRNPLAPISAAADLLLSAAPPDAARVRQIGAIIARQAGHLTHLVDDLLDVSRVTRGHVRLNRSAQDVNEIVRDAVEQVRPLLNARGHHFSLQLAADACWVAGDRKRLVQVLVNLLGNAAKYTPDGGQITLSTTLWPQCVTMEVRDNGIGMSGALVARAFEPFSQGQRTSERAEGGLGIGLALVRALVNLHGGSVSADSAGAHAGSLFCISLPRLKPAPVMIGDPGLPAPANAAPLRILVVDDNVDAATMLAMFLEAAGHCVQVEHGAQQALARAGKMPVDVFLLDIGLPEMDGNALARRLRAMPELADAILIAVTGYGQAQDQADAVAAGFHHHFVKPVDCARLTALLNAIATDNSCRQADRS